jgi:hypothetical protein
MSRSKRAAGGLALATALVLAPATHADKTTVSDPKDDVADGLEYLDIRKAVATHAEGGKLRHVVRVEKVEKENENTTRAIQIIIKVGSKRFVIYGSGPGKAPVMNQSSGNQTGNAKLHRSGKRVIFDFDPKVIGNPAAYKWYVEASPNPGIYTGKYDRAPNKGTRRHEIGSAAGATVTRR